jgi:hypothetical protein
MSCKREELPEMGEVLLETESEGWSLMDWETVAILLKNYYRLL